MERDEYRTEQDAESAGQRCEGETQAHAGADEADRDREEVKISEEPERPLIDDPAVPFVLGNVIDRFVFYSQSSTVASGSPSPRPESHQRKLLE